MNSLISSLFLIILPINLCTAENLVCVFNSWAVYKPGRGMYNASYLPADLCTHVNYAYVGLNSWDGTLAILDDWEANGLEELDHLKRKRNENPDLKLLVTMGGWNDGSVKYSRVSADPNLRKNMINSVLVFLDKYKFDGFNLDWEYPGQRDGAKEDSNNFITLLRELKEAFAAKKYILSVDVIGSKINADVSYHIKEISDAVDMINVIFDEYPHEGVQHVSPLYPSHLDKTDIMKTRNVRSEIELWLSEGAEPKKLNMGLTTFGRGFKLADPRNTSLYAPMIGQFPAVYNEICKFYSNYTYYWDDEQKLPHIVKGDQWITYEDQRSFRYKMEYAKSKGLGGLMVNSLDTDDFRGDCGEGKYPLINSLKGVLNE